MAGLNVAGEIPWIKAGYRFELGVYVPHRRRAKITNDDLLVIVPRPAGEYEYVTPDGSRPLVVDDVPFAKWTLGLDYTIGPYVYLNAMWVHGFADEFGAGDFFHPGVTVRSGGVSEGASLGFCALGPPRDGTECAYEIVRPTLGDYAVLGIDLKLFDQRLLMRLFTIFDLTGYERREFDPVLGERVSTKYSPFSEEGFSAVIYPEVNYSFGNGLELGGGAILQLGKTYTKFGDPAAGGSLVFVRGRYGF